MNFTIFTSKCIGNKQNTFYPTEHQISSEDEMDGVIVYDHVCARYKNNLRSSSNFLESDVVVMDCDNEHTENPDDWMTPQKLGELLGDVSFVTAPSRHNNLVKDGKGPRPRFHVYFPIPTIESDKEYADLKNRIYEAYNFFDKNALDAGRFIFGSKKGQCYWHEGKQSIVEILEEGLQDFDEIIPEGHRNSTLSRYAGCVLKRYGNSDKAFELFNEKADNCDPPLGETELKAIWNSAVKFFNNKIVSQKDYVSPEQYNNDFKIPPKEWEKPIFPESDNIPAFPIDALPPVLRNYAKAVSTFTQTPIDMAAVSVLTVGSVCMRNCYKVKGQTGWTEPTNLYCVVVADPSERKSAVLSLVKEPISNYVNEYNAKNKYAVDMSRAQKKKLENTRDSLLSHNRKKGLSKEADDFDDELQSVIYQLADFQEVRPLKVFVDDITPEKLAEVLAENDGAISLISSEGGIFDVLSGTYSNKVNIDVFLKAYSGDDIQVERINRTSLDLRKPCLTILLTVQPVVISDFMANRRFKHRGLTARFLYSLPKTFVGSRDLTAMPVPDAVTQSYQALVDNLLSEKKEDTPKFVTVSDEAWETFVEYYKWIEKMLSGDYKMDGSWLGKLAGNTLRIAGVLARCSVIGTNPSVKIEKDVMDNAIAIGKYFLAHSMAVFELMGVDTDFKAASRAIEKIKSLGLRKITRRDVMRHCRWVGSADEAQKVIDTLENHNFIRLSALDASDKIRFGKAKNAIFDVNPWVFE